LFKKLAHWASMSAPNLLVDDDGLPTICDAVYATVAANEDGLAATLRWALSVGYGRPLVLLDWDVAPLRPDTWGAAGSALENDAAQTRARGGSMGIFVEDPAFAQQALERGVYAQGIPAHIIAPAFWPNLCLLAAHHVDAGDVKLAGPAMRKIVETLPDGRKRRQFAALPRVAPGPRGDDPTVPAWLFGIVLGVDEGAATPPPPARVKVAA
jgi:hypothetical protein